MQSGVPPNSLQHRGRHVDERSLDVVPLKFQRRPERADRAAMRSYDKLEDPGRQDSEIARDTVHHAELLASLDQPRHHATPTPGVEIAVAAEARRLPDRRKMG